MTTDNTQLTAEPTNPYFAGEVASAPRAADSFPQDRKLAEERLRKANEQNDKPLVDKVSTYVNAAWEGGVFQSAKDGMQDLWTNATQRQADYKPTIDQILEQSKYELNREEAKGVAERAANPYHAADLIERVKDFRKAQEVLSMADGWGNTISFGAQLVDGLPLAVATAGTVGSLSMALRAGAATRALLAVGVNAGVGAGQEALQSYIGMRPIDPNQMLGAAVFSGALGVLDMNTRVARGTKVDVSAKAPAATAVASDAVQAAAPVVPTPVRSVLSSVDREGVQELMHASGRSVGAVLKREHMDDLLSKVQVAKQAIAKAVSEGATPTLIAQMASKAESELVDSLGLTQFKGGFLQTFSDKAAAEALHVRLLDDIAASPEASHLKDSLVAARMDAEGRFNVHYSERTIVDNFKDVPVRNHGLQETPALAKVEPSIDIGGARVNLQYDNPLDKALFVAAHGTEAEKAVAREFLKDNLQGLSKDEIETAIKENGGISPHLEMSIAANGRGVLAQGGNHVTMRVPDGSDHLVSLSRGRQEVSAQSKVDGLSYEDSTHGAELQGLAEKHMPGVPTVQGPVVAVDANGNLKGHWDSRSPDKDAALWKQATAIVKSAPAFNKKDVKAWFEVSGFAEHYQAVLTKVKGLPQTSERLVKRLVSEEIYAKASGKPAVLGVGLAVVASAAAAQDAGLVENSQEPLMMAGIFIGAKGAFNLKGTPHEHVFRDYETAQAMHTSGMDAEEIRQKTNWFIHPADGKWRYEVSTKDSFHTDLSAAIKDAKKKQPKVVNQAAEDFAKTNAADLEYIAARGWVSKATLTKYLRTNDEWYLPQIVQLLRDHGGAGTEVAARLESHMKNPEAIAGAKALADTPKAHITLDQFTNDPLLMTAYPEFKNVKVTETKGKTTLGATIRENGVTDEISVTTALGKEQTRETGVHEVQHVVQDIEGFARGGTPQADGGYSNYDRLGGEVEARNAAARKDLSNEQIRQADPLLTADFTPDEVIVKFNNGQENHVALSYSDTPLAQAVNGFPNPKASGEGSDKTAQKATAPSRNEFDYVDDPTKKNYEIVNGKKVYKDTHAHLNLGVLDANLVEGESLKMQDTNELYLSKVRLKGRDVRTGFSVASVTGSSRSNTVRRLQSLLFNSWAGRQAGTETGNRVMLNEMTGDVLKKSFAQRHFGRLIVDSEKTFFEYAAANRLSYKDTRYFKEEAKVFFDRVGRAYRGVNDMDPHVQKAVKEMRETLRGSFDEMQGVLKPLPEDLPADSLLGRMRDTKWHDNYFPRIWDGKALANLVYQARDVRDIYRVFADSFVYGDGHRPPLEAREKTAKELVHFLLKLKDDPSIGNLATASADEIAAAAARYKGISDQTLWTYLSFGGVDAQRYVSGRLQARIDINELTQGINIPTKDGGSMQVAIMDLMVNDPRAAFGNYLNMTSGMYALGIKSLDSGYDLTSNAFWDTAFAQAHLEGADPKELTYLKEGRNALLAAGKTTTIMKEESELGTVLRNLTTLKNSTGFVFATLGEMGYNKSLKVFGEVGLVGYLKNLGELTREGRIKGDLARDLQYAMGTGLEGLTPSLLHMVENNSIDTADGLVSRLVNQKMKSTGFQQANAFQQHIVQAVAIGRLAEYGLMKKGTKGLREFSAGEWERLRSFGIDEALMDRLTPTLQKHIKYGPEGEVLGLNFQGMSQDDPVGTATLQGALFRIAKFATSDEAGMGEVVPFMTGDLGKFAFQFQQVVARSFEKAKRSILIRDGDEMARVALSFLGAGVGHIMKTAVMFSDDDKEWEKRMTVEAIMKAAFRNMALSGPIPTFVDLAGATVFGVAPFADSSNSDRAMRFSVPAIDTAVQVAQNIQGAFGNLSSDDSMSQKGIKEGLKLSPLPHYMYPLAGFSMDAMGIQERDPVQRETGK